MKHKFLRILALSCVLLSPCMAMAQDDPSVILDGSDLIKHPAPAARMEAIHLRNDNVIYRTLFSEVPERGIGADIAADCPVANAHCRIYVHSMFVKKQVVVFGEVYITHETDGHATGMDAHSFSGKLSDDGKIGRINIQGTNLSISGMMTNCQSGDCSLQTGDGNVSGKEDEASTDVGNYINASKKTSGKMHVREPDPPGFSD